jgi:hypothetical protein
MSGLFSIAADPTLLGAFKLLFALIIGHALGDFALQTEYVALRKNRHFTPASPRPESEQRQAVWVHCLTAHALIHAGLVWAISGALLAGLAELVLHWGIDFLKCDQRLTYTQDQLTHLLCKALYVGALLQWPALN